MPSPYTTLRALCREMCQRLDRQRVAHEAGEAACAASTADVTLRCLKCGYRWSPDSGDWYEVGPLSFRSRGDGPRDQAIECPTCGRQLSESEVEDI